MTVEGLIKELQKTNPKKEIFVSIETRTFQELSPTAGPTNIVKIDFVENNFINITFIE